MNRLLAVISRHWKPLFIFNFLIILAATYKARNLPDLWQASAKLVIPQASGQINASLGKLGNFTNREPTFSVQLNPLELLSTIMLSEQALTQVLDSDEDRESFEDLTDYRKNFSTQIIEGTAILSLHASAETPEVASSRVTSVIETLQVRLNELRQNEAQESLYLIKNDLSNAEVNLKSLQNEISKFRNRSGLVDSDSQIRVAVESLERLSSQYSDLLSEQQANISRVEHLSSRLKLPVDGAADSLNLGEDSAYQLRRRQLTEVESELADAQSIYQDSHPIVQALNDKRQALLEQKMQYAYQKLGTTELAKDNIGPQFAELVQQLLLAESSAKAQTLQATQLQGQIEQLEGWIRNVPLLQAQLTELERQYDIAEGVYNGLVAKSQEASLLSFNAYPGFQVLDEPRLQPQSDTARLYPILASAALVSIFGSAALVLLLESRSPLLTPADVSAAEFPILGVVPNLKKRSFSEQSTPELAFQRLASAFSMMEGSNRVLITSAGSGEGKTTVTMGLARALVDLGFRVLVIDADFQKSTLTKQVKHLGAGSNNEGLIIRPTSILPGIDLMPNNIRYDQSSNTAEFIARGDFTSKIDLAQSLGNYDYVLIDSSPVGLTSETTLIGSAVKNVLFVSRAGLSERDKVYGSVAELSRHRINLLGMVINQAGEQLQAAHQKPSLLA